MSDFVANMIKFQAEMAIKLQAQGIPKNKLKFKYTVQVTSKFGGKKRKTSNSGGVGRAARRARRAIVISSRCGAEQYKRWCAAGCPTL